MVFHLLLLLIVPTCLLAGWWQAHRALSGNTLSWAYTFEWPIFAIIAVFGWWQLLTEDPAEVEARKEERARRSREVGPPTPDPIPEPVRLAITVTAGPGLPAGPGSSSATEVEDTEVQSVEAAAASLDRYNEYLASLADKGKAKTWRNPQGRP